MDLKNTILFEQCIDHYRGILRMDPGEAPEANQCVLCREYPSTDCTNSEHIKCPIVKRTDYIGCGDTPWSDAHKAYYDMAEAGRNWYTTEEYDAIELELKWLKSFLPTLRMIPYV